MLTGLSFSKVQNTRDHEAYLMDEWENCTKQVWLLTTDCVLYHASWLVILVSLHGCRAHDWVQLFGPLRDLLGCDDVIVWLVHTDGHEFQDRCFAEMADMYAKAIKNEDAPLELCVSFINCAKIRISRQGGLSSLQGNVYSGHNRADKLIYQTVTTHNGTVSISTPQGKDEVTIYWYIVWQIWMKSYRVACSSMVISIALPWSCIFSTWVVESRVWKAWEVHGRAWLLQEYELAASKCGMELWGSERIMDCKWFPT